MTLSASDGMAEGQFLKLFQALGQRLDASQIMVSENLPAISQSNLKQVFADHPIPAIVYPNSQDQLANIVSWANQSKQKILIIGSGSKVQWGNVIPATDLIVSTKHLDRVIDHAIGDLTVTVEAGMPFATLQSQLRETDQMIALDPTYSETATIGGILATRDAGSLIQRYGSVRDMCLGLSFVRADGQQAKAGGRVVKNVAGYDLMKLFAGSYGTLGIISEVTLRLYPIQESSQTVLFSGDVKAIAQFTRQLLDSTLTPVSIDLLSKDLLAQLDIQANQGLAVRFQSLKESVVAQVNRIKALGSGLRITNYDTDADTEFWQKLRHTLWTQSETTAIAKFGLLPSQGSSALDILSHWASQNDISAMGLCHAGSGLGVVQLHGDDDALEKVLSQLRSHCEQHQGFLTILEAPISLKQTLDLWGYPGNALGVMKQLKDQFDPHRLLNPGRFVGGL